ncbi:MAG TPA: YraN family protein [Acidisarcina sp.]
MTLSRSALIEPAIAEGPRDAACIKPRPGWLLDHLLRTCDGLSQRLGRTPRLAPHLELGVRGEEAAFFYLRRLGYVIVAQRWRSYRHPGDLDLIGWDGETLCFIEVKTRTSHAIAEAEAAVDRDKRRTLRRLAWHYLRYLPTPSSEARFDVLTVYLQQEKKTEFHLFRGAFGWSEHRDRES